MSDDINFSDYQNLTFLNKKKKRNILSTKYRRHLDIKKIKKKILDDICLMKNSNR
jgi:hypothetical protein